MPPKESALNTSEMSAAAQHALEDMVAGQMYLLAQSQQTPWPMFPRTRTKAFETKKAHSTSVELSAVKELLDLGFIEATSNRTLVVSKSGCLFYQGTRTRLSA